MYETRISIVEKRRSQSVGGGGGRRGNKDSGQNCIQRGEGRGLMSSKGRKVEAGRRKLQRMID